MGWLQQKNKIMAVYEPGHTVGTGGCSLMLPQTAALQAAFYAGISLVFTAQLKF